MPFRSLGYLSPQKEPGAKKRPSSARAARSVSPRSVSTAFRFVPSVLLFTG